MKDNYNKLIYRIQQMNLLWSAYADLGWDKEVMMPPNANPIRMMEFEAITNITHDILSNRKTKELINKSKKEDLTKKEKLIVKQIERYYKGSKATSVDLSKKISRVSFEAYDAWKEAKKRNDFSIFSPHLKKIINLSKKHDIQFYGEKEFKSTDNKYDFSIAGYDNDFDTSDLDELFRPVKEKLMPFLQKVRHVHKEKQFDNRILDFKPDFKSQKKFCEKIAYLIGYDFKKGRLDTSLHPFTWSYGRITMKKDDTLLDSIYTNMHEAGHGMYEHNLPIELYATPAGTAASMAVHESQSRFWENHIGKSRPFSNFLLDQLKEEFGVDMKYDDFYKTVNQINPDNMIRIHADELTYPFHIIMRYDIEQFLYNDMMSVEDIPDIWNESMDLYFNKVPSCDTDGCLQDPHWADGFGYFPCYLIGSMISALLDDKINQHISGLEQKIESGSFSEINEWLKRKIHSKGEIYDTHELVEKATRRKLSAKYYIDYLINKYSEIYDL